MKIMIRKIEQGYTVYVPKKDLEEPVTAQEKDSLWGGFVTLANGWKLQLPDMPAETTFPVTVVATKVE